MTVRSTTVLLIALHAGVAVAWIQAGTVAGLLTMAVLHGLLVAATLRPQNGLFGSVLCRIPDAPEKSVCLTIDDGPCEDTAEILAILDDFGATATFFLIGSRAIGSPGDVEAIQRSGHVIGNHTWTHPAGRFWAYGPGAQRREVLECQEILGRLANRTPEWFRAPAGFRNPYNGPVLREAGLQCAGWHARGFDTSERDVSRIVRRLTRRLEPGAILLIHQGHPHSPALLRALLTALRDQGWSANLSLPCARQTVS